MTCALSPASLLQALEGRIPPRQSGRQEGEWLVSRVGSGGGLGLKKAMVAHVVGLFRAACERAAPSTLHQNPEVACSEKEAGF